MTQLSWLDILTLASAIGASLVAGFFFAFSTTVMKALGALPPAQGVAGMQSINVVVINPWFFAAFFGVALLSLVLIGTALFRWSDPRAVYWLIGGVLYVVGTIVVTVVFTCRATTPSRALRPRARKVPITGPTTFPPGPRGTTCGRSRRSWPRSSSRSR